MARVAQIRSNGGPEVIEWVDVDLPAPGPGEVRVRTRAVGLNFIDTYFRRGLYPAPLPTGLGLEAAAVVEELGPGVTAFMVGDRVGSFMTPIGAYATERVLPTASLIALPDHIDDRTAAAVMLKGCTTEFLVERCAKVQPGWAVLVHAASGATGQLLVQWLKHIGAMVIGTVSTEAKAAQALAIGADHVIRYDCEDTAKRVREITGGAGVRVVFDGVGMATWESSLDSCGKRGLIVSFGNADAPVGGVNLAILAAKGSLYNTRPTLFDYYATPQEVAAGTARLFDLIRQGALKIEIGQEFALEDVAKAHIALESRQTTGSTVLLP